MFEELLKENCFAEDPVKRAAAAAKLEELYGCEISALEMAPDVLFAHHARGCTIIAAKICQGAVIYQNVTIGSNLKYNKETHSWENVGNPVIGQKVIIADGAKILGPVIVGDNSVVAAGAIVTKNIPTNSLVYGVNQIKPKDPKYDYVYRPEMIATTEIIQTWHQLIAQYNREK